MTGPVAPLMMVLAAPAISQPGPQTTQHKINDYAAAIERCRHEILEAGALRAAGEPLPAYLERVCVGIKGETRSQYLHRIAGYVRSMEQVTSATVDARIPPTLKSSDSTNAGHWNRASKDLSYLPRRMEHVRSAWNTVEHAQGDAGRKELASELLQTLQLMLDAYSHLRDARP